MTEIFLVVFEDGRLKLADADMIFMDRDVAEAVKRNYERAYYSARGARKLFVRSMRVDMRTVDKLVG